MRFFKTTLCAVVVETEEAINTIHHTRNSITLKQQFRHHLPTVMRVARSLGEDQGMFHMTLITENTDS